MKNRNQIIAVTVAVVVVGIFFINKTNFSFLESNNVEKDMTTQNQAGALNAVPNPEVQITDVLIGTGTEAVNGMMVKVHYTGTLTDGKKFDSSLDRGEPIPFILGTGQVIPGWEAGILGMKVGGKRHLVIPPELGYGDQPIPSAVDPLIPANSTLIFDVELVGVEEVAR